MINLPTIRTITPVLTPVTRPSPMTGIIPGGRIGTGPEGAGTGLASAITGAVTGVITGAPTGQATGAGQGHTPATGQLADNPFSNTFNFQIPQPSTDMGSSTVASTGSSSGYSQYLPLVLVGVAVAGLGYFLFTKKR